ncbi:MAG: hypothetical protein LBT53_03340 [Puniceicoccales bacterium]|nr:hypothetical protein [Puniceicoccales bacterium]
MALKDYGITERHEVTFSQNVAQEAQQRQPRFDGTYNVDVPSGALRLVSVSKRRKMTILTTRVGETPITPQQWIRRGLVAQSAADGDLYDLKDDTLKTRMLAPQSDMVRNTISAGNRYVDYRFLRGLLGPTLEQVGPEVTDLAPQTLPSEQVIPSDLDGTPGTATDLTLAKLIALRIQLGFTDDDEVVASGAKLYLAHTQSQLFNLLDNVRQVADSRYADVKALVDGKINYFMGFHWISSEQLNLFADTNGLVPTVGWAQSAIHGGKVYDGVEVNQRPDRTNAMQVLNRVSAGFVRVQDSLVSVTYNQQTLEAPASSFIP